MTSSFHAATKQPTTTLVLATHTSDKGISSILQQGLPTQPLVAVLRIWTTFVRIRIRLKGLDLDLTPDPYKFFLKF